MVSVKTVFTILLEQIQPPALQRQIVESVLMTS
jgi:hypothetical protein